MKDIVTVGEILIDLTYSERKNDVPLYTANPGGAPAGVDASGMLSDEDARTTMAVVSVSETGERSFSFYRRNCADVLLRSEEISLDMLSDTHFLHFGSVSLTDEPSRSATVFAAEKAKEFGATVTYDPNYRANLWKNEAQAVEQMKSVLGKVDILKISDEELPLLTGTKDCEEGTRQLREQYGIPLILLTLGADGAFYRRGDETGKSGRSSAAWRRWGFTVLPT